MRITAIAASALVLAALSAQTAKAGLTGDTVDISGYYPDTTLPNNYDDAGTFVVPTASVEVFSGIPNTYVTVSDSQVTLAFDAIGTYSAATFDGIVVTDETSSDISGVTVDGATDLVGFNSSFLSYTASSISINLSGLSTVTGDEVVVVDLSTSVGTPEPISVSLLATGLIGLGVARRRKAARSRLVI